MSTSDLARAGDALPPDPHAVLARLWAGRAAGGLPRGVTSAALAFDRAARDALAPHYAAIARVAASAEIP